MLYIILWVNFTYFNISYYEFSNKELLKYVSNSASVICLWQDFTNRQKSVSVLLIYKAKMDGVKLRCPFQNKSSEKSDKLKQSIN